MNEKTNDPVARAFWARWYVDTEGREWHKGLDGWFHDDGDETILIRHEEMATKIEDERP